MFSMFITVQGTCQEIGAQNFVFYLAMYIYF